MCVVVVEGMGKKGSNKEGLRAANLTLPHVQLILCSQMLLLCSVPLLREKKKVLSTSNQFPGAKSSIKGPSPGEVTCLISCIQQYNPKLCPTMLSSVNSHCKLISCVTLGNLLNFFCASIFYLENKNSSTLCLGVEETHHALKNSAQPNQ